MAYKERTLSFPPVTAHIEVGQVGLEGQSILKTRPFSTIYLGILMFPAGYCTILLGNGRMSLFFLEAWEVPWLCPCVLGLWLMSSPTI